MTDDGLRTGRHAADRLEVDRLEVDRLEVDQLEVDRLEVDRLEVARAEPAPELHRRTRPNSPGTRPGPARTRPEAPRADPDPDPLRAEVDLLRQEADRLGEENDPLRAGTILVVGAGYAGEEGGAGGLTTALARDLAAIAAHVTVFTGTTAPGTPAPATTTSTGPRPFTRRPRRTTARDRGVQVVSHRHHLPAGPGGLNRARYERSFLRAVLGSPVRATPDLVIGVLPSVGAAVAASRIAHRFRVPLLLVVQELAVPRPRRSGRSPGGTGGLVGAAVARGQAEALAQAARVVLVGADLRDSVVDLGVAQGRIEVLGTGGTADLREVVRALLRHPLFP